MYMLKISTLNSEGSYLGKIGVDKKAAEIRIKPNTTKPSSSHVNSFINSLLDKAIGSLNLHTTKLVMKTQVNVLANIQTIVWMPN